MPRRWFQWSARIPGLDRRAIALFRISLGCVLLLDLLLFHGAMLPFLFPGYFIATGTCFALLLLPGSADRGDVPVPVLWGRSYEARFELFVFDLGARDRNAPIVHETLIDWSAAHGIKSLREIRREAAAIARDSAG